MPFDPPSGKIPPDLHRERAVSQNTPSPDRSHDVSESGDRYEALVEVLEQQKLQQERGKAQESKERDSKRGGQPFWLVFALLIIAGWLWLLPPEPLRMNPPDPQPVAQEEAALRFAMYLQAQRILAYQQEAGRLPLTLETAGPPLPGMEYTLLQDGLYQLTGSTDRLTLTYRSDLPLDTFVGTGADIVNAGQLP